MASISVPLVQKVAEVEEGDECTFEKDPSGRGAWTTTARTCSTDWRCRSSGCQIGKVAIVGYNDQLARVSWRSSATEGSAVVRAAKLSQRLHELPSRKAQTGAPVF